MSVSDDGECDWCGKVLPNENLGNETQAGDAICDGCFSNYARGSATNNHNRILGVLKDVREALHLYHRDDVRFKGLIGDVKAAVAELEEKGQ